MGNVNYKIVGNSDDAQKAVDRLRSQFEKLEMSLRNQAKHSRQAQSAGAAHMQQQIQFAKSLVLNLVSVQTAWDLARKAFEAYSETNKRVQDLRGQAAPNARETEIKMINQGQLNKEEVKRTIQNVDEQTLSVPVGDVTDSKRITEEAFSQGFDRQEVINGDILKAFLELKAATNQYGMGATDSKELVKSLATSLRNREGRDPTAAITSAEIQEFGKAFQALFLTQSIQLQDAIPFARIQAILSARGIENKTQLAAFSVAVDAFGSGEVAATYLQQATAYMGRAGSEKMQKKLEKLGIEIDGTKFDLIGEDLVEGFKNLKTALDGLNPRQKADALDALFGTKAQAGALTLMGKAENIQDSEKKIEKSVIGNAYQDAIDNFKSSARANSQKKANTAEIKSVEGFKSQGELTFDDVQKIFDATFEELKKQNASTANLVIDKMQADAEYWLTGKNQTPAEYLKSVQVKSNDRAQYNIDSNRPNSDAIGTARILNQQIDASDPRTDQMKVIADRLRKEAAAAGVEFADQLPQKAPDVVQNQAAKAALWNEFDLKKKQIEADMKKEQDSSVYSYFGGLGGNPIGDWLYPESTKKNEREDATKPLYEEYRKKAEELDKPAVDPNADAAAGGQIKFPEKMEVSDPDLQAGINQLNTTMNNVLTALTSGPDKQRIVKLPRQSGTA